MTLKLFFPGIPFSKQSVRANPVYNRKTGEPVIYKDKLTGKKRVLISFHQPKKVVEQEKSIKAMTAKQIPKNFTPFRGPVIVKELLFVFPPLSTWPKYKLYDLAQGKVFYKDTKPDITDNLCKGLFDAMEGIIYMNDSQICEQGLTRKIYGLKPGIYLTIEGNKEQSNE